MNKNQQIKKSIHYRGRYLESVAAMELGLNLYLAYHFCGNNFSRILDMQLLILGDERMSLSSKIQVFYVIGTHHDKKWFDGYVGTFGNTNKDLNIIIENRNVFAHRLLDVKSTNNESINYLRFKNDIETQKYTEEIFNKLIQTIRNLTQYFIDRNGKSLMKSYQK